MKKLTAIILLLIFALGAVVQAQRDPKEIFEGQVPAPEFPANLDWINVDQPLTIAGLQGKIIIFDFWTYGCINCLHLIPILEQVEKKFADEVVVIGVHSAKFENEGQTENQRQIVQRYGIHHPVINDVDFNVWRAYGVKAWPTVAVIDPRGYVVVRQSGEIPFTAFDSFLSGMITYYDGLDENIIDRTPLDLALEGAGDPGTPLLFPGKVLADEASNRLFIADSNHNRIVIADQTTREVLDIIGSSVRGHDDGSFDSASFDKPQGMALAGDLLYIADVNNHAIRVADLSARAVSTVAGNGIMGTQRIPFGVPVTEPLNVSLRSPWDLEFDDQGQLHVAMAGTHQLYIYDPESGILYPSVGNGREANLNNVSLAQSELAQPSGLYFAGEGKLYFADSESSTIRLADFANNLVTVVSGTTANNLFDYGDVDGELDTNLLQHALDMQGTPNGDLYIADTYNSRIKRIPAGETGTWTAFGLGGLGGYEDGDPIVAQFDEPGGLSYAHGILYVADTNNHVVRAIDLETGYVDTFEFSNPEVLVIDPDALTLLGGNAGDTDYVAMGVFQVATGDGALNLHLVLPPAFTVNPLIESNVAVRVGEASEQIIVPVTEKEIRIPVTYGEDDSFVITDLTLYYCRYGEEQLCFIDISTLFLMLEVSPEHAQTEILLEREIVPPDL